MENEINLHLYEGLGVPISKRDQMLPKYKALVDVSDPKSYIAEKGLRDAVNVALALGQPLLVTGEPGTGKTQLAAAIAYELDLPKVLEFYTKTTSTATDLFYQYDALRRFQDTQLPGKKKINIEDYITYQALGKAILLTKPTEEVKEFLPKELHGIGPTRSVVLIDEIDKSPRDFPNDILNEIEKIQFKVKETERTFKANEDYRPIIIITSNSEKNLPDPFLRRCVFYHISFPSPGQLHKIIQKKFLDHPGFTPGFIEGAIEHFFEIRELATKKKPATAEFITWIRILQKMKIDISNINNLNPGEIEALALSYSILAKTNDDLALLKEKFIKNNGKA
jgi:MoxR-like ATPase